MQGFDLIIRMDSMHILRTGWILISFYTVHVVCVQEFLEKPQNMSVVKGQTAVMKCSVQNRAGLVQWARDGLMLGYDRKIPGYSRYSMIGNNDQEYHLQIIDVNLGDDADLSCQVSPAVNNPPLVAMGHLTVLVPPNMPEIVDHANGSSIEVRYTDPVLQLTCIATNGRPAAMIKWYRSGEEQTSKVEYSVEPIPNDKRQNARSVITISPRYPDDNGVIYTCEARNEALIGGPLQVKVKLSVLYPPATPVITGYRLNEIVRTNDTMSLTCTSEGGNPLAQVVWFKNNEEIDFSYTQANNKAVNYLTFTAQPSDNNAEYRCEATNVVTPQPLVAKIKLIVHFAPKKVTISGDKLAKAGEVVTLSCQSANSNPAAAITWFAKGRQLAETTSRVEESPDGGYITYSEVTVTMTHQDNNIIYSCQATNEQLGQTVAATATLSVLYPPDPPQITGYTEGESIRAGDLKRMTCSAVGGNPLATLKWFKGDAEIPAESPGPPVGNIATSEIAIVTKADDNGAIYKCTASNDATAVPLEAVKRLTVHFPPPSVGITTDPTQPKAGHKLTLTCVSASSNPGAVITWINNNRRIQGIDKGMTPSEYGGKSTTNILEFVPTSEHHQAVYGCRATNLLLSETVNDGITLDVLYKPEFNDTISPSSIEIAEGTSKTVNFTVSANPPLVNYTLIKYTESADASSLTLENGLLQIASITRAATGSYGIVSENSEGSTRLNFSIAVLFPATIEPPEKVEADVGTKAELKCKAVASPMTANMIKWTREGFDMTRTRESYQDGVGMLIIEELAKGDSGKFTCVADNGVGSAVTAEVELLVRYGMADRATNEAMSKISVIVMKLLHQIGINKKTRKWRRYVWTQHETLLSLIQPHQSGYNVPVFVFGSQIEGSTTPGLRPDTDRVLFHDIFAIRNIQDSALGINAVLMVTDEETHPGYYKLQRVNPFSMEAMHARHFESVPYQNIAIDRHHRIVLNNQFFFYNHATEIHGPAATLSNEYFTEDYIIAVKIATRTQDDISWLSRPRKNTWITPNESEYFLEKKLFLVPVGNPLSRERHLEWRLSFTAIERELMWRLNNTQIACCVLMKMINKCIITPVVGKCVSSYHCKTLLFHLIDNTNVGFWKPNNLLTCLNLMIKTLSSWVESGFCPNYFITNENMFLGKLDGQLRTRLHSVLVHLIDQDFKYLTQIGCDGLGQTLSEVCSKHHTQPDAVPLVLEAFQRRNDRDLQSHLTEILEIGMTLSYITLLRFGERDALHSLIQGYQTCNTVLQDSLRVLTALLCSHFGSQLASSSIATNSMYCRNMEMAHMFLWIGTNFDVTAGRLKLAGFYLKLGYASLAEEVLIGVEQHFGHIVSDVSLVEPMHYKNETIHKVLSEEMTTDQAFKSCVALSVIYLPSEIHCTLPPLCFEMFRSTGADPDLRDPEKDYWYDWAVVDARPYMYFLQHQTYSALGKETHRMVALKNLAWSITQERIRHVVTCLNLLAYCLRQEGLVNLALKYLLLSLQVMLEHNAAVWQILDMLTQIRNNQTMF